MDWCFSSLDLENAKEMHVTEGHFCYFRRMGMKVEAARGRTDQEKPMFNVSIR